jgi:hypothetical protein
VSQAALLSLRGPAAPAPAPDRSDPQAKLAERLQGVYFPNYSPTLGWHAIGVRRDVLAGRPAVTVYYGRGSQQVAYTVVGAPALSQPAVPVSRQAGVEMRLFTVHGHSVVTWRRADQTCVLTASGVAADALEQMAAWRPVSSE